MDEAKPNQRTPGRISLTRRSNRNYDDLIREYIRAARERLEAAKRNSPTSSTSARRSTVPTPASEPHTRPVSIAPPQPSYDRQTSAVQDGRNPFTDALDHGGPIREASLGRSHRATLTRILRSSSHDPSTIRDHSCESEAREFLGKARISRTPTPSRGRHRSARELALAEDAPFDMVLPSGQTYSLSGDLVELEPHAGSPAPTHPSVLHPSFLHRPGTGASLSSSAALSSRYGTLPSSMRQTPLSERVGSKRPTPLDLTAVREAEARGSLTSLSDLIKRALRLASNLETGRTASKFGTDWAIGGSPEKDSSRQYAANWPFAPDGTPLGTPGNRRQGPMSPWSPTSGLYRSGGDPDGSMAGLSRHGHRGRCCGMPLWLFILILIVIVLLIAAAVLVPIFLIVVPQHRSSSACENGGTSFTSSGGSPQCICVNGFTGASCRRIDNTGCVVANTLAAANATVGAGIPIVLESATSKYGINLDAPSIFGLLSAFDLTCASETNLVTFNGLSSRSLKHLRRSPPDTTTLPTTVTTSSSGAGPTPTSTYHSAARWNSTSGVATSDGIIFATSSTSTLPATTTATPASPSAASTSASPSSSSSFLPSSEQTLGFARTAVLFILQNTEQLAQAQTAHAALSTFFADPGSSNAEDYDLGGGWTANLVRGTISDPQGDVFGG